MKLNDVFTTRDEMMFAKFIDQMFTATGKREFTYIEIFNGVSKFGIQSSDWKGVLDSFVAKGWLIKDGNTIKLGQVFDFLTESGLKRMHLIAGLDTIREICKSLLGEGTCLTKTLPEQVKLLEKTLEKRNG